MGGVGDWRPRGREDDLHQEECIWDCRQCRRHRPSPPTHVVATGLSTKPPVVHTDVIFHRKVRSLQAAQSSRVHRRRGVAHLSQFRGPSRRPERRFTRRRRRSAGLAPPSLLSGSRSTQHCATRRSAFRRTEAGSPGRPGDGSRGDAGVQLGSPLSLSAARAVTPALS